MFTFEWQQIPLGWFRLAELADLYSSSSPVSVDLRVNRISAISGHMHRLEARRIRRGASGTPACACLPNDAYAQRWRLIRQTLIYLQPLEISWCRVPTKQFFFEEIAFEVRRKEGANHGWISLQTRGTSTVHSILTVLQVQKCSWTQRNPEESLFMHSGISHFMWRTQEWMSLWIICWEQSISSYCPTVAKFTLDVPILHEWMPWNLNECRRAWTPSWKMYLPTSFLSKYPMSSSKCHSFVQGCHWSSWWFVS